jgi:predicted permease
MLSIFLLVLPVFAVMGCGAILRLTNAADDVWVEILNRYGLYIGFPALIFESLLHVERSSLGEYIFICFLTTGLLFFIIILVWISSKAFRLDRVSANTFIICSFFGNIAYLGYPITTKVFQGVEAQVSLIIALYVFLLFTVGIFILEVSKTQRGCFLHILVNIVKNPFIISIVAGITFVLLRIRLPLPFERALQMLKESASPVVLVALGIFMVRKLKLRGILLSVSTLTSIKLFIVPLIFYGTGIALQMVPHFRVPVLEAAMPIAVTPFALSSVYPLDREVIAASIVVSTLLSIITLPLFIYIV